MISQVALLFFLHIISLVANPVSQESLNTANSLISPDSTIIEVPNLNALGTEQ